MLFDVTFQYKQRKKEHRWRWKVGQKQNSLRELSGGVVVAKYITSRRIGGDLWTRLATCIYQASNQQWLFQLAQEAGLSTQFQPLYYTFWPQLLITRDEPAWDRARDVINHEVSLNALRKKRRNSPTLGTPSPREGSKLAVSHYHTN